MGSRYNMIVKYCSIVVLLLSGVYSRKFNLTQSEYSKVQNNPPAACGNLGGWMQGGTFQWNGQFTGSFTSYFQVTRNTYVYDAIFEGCSAEFGSGAVPAYDVTKSENQQFYNSFPQNPYWFSLTYQGDTSYLWCYFCYNNGYICEKYQHISSAEQCNGEMPYTNFYSYINQRTNPYTGSGGCNKLLTPSPLGTLNTGGIMVPPNGPLPALGCFDDCNNNEAMWTCMDPGYQ